MASPGPALSHLTMLSCTAPHRSSASTPCPRRHPSFCALLHHRPPPPASTPGPSYPLFFPHGSILLLCHHHPHPSAPTCPGSLCHLHGLVEPSLPSLSPPRSPVYPGALSLLAHSGSSCPQDPPPPHPPPRGPPPCLLSQQLLPFHLSAHSCSHVGLFLGGTEPFRAAAPGRAGGSKTTTRRQKRARWSGGRGSQGPGKGGGRGRGQGGLEMGLGWRQRAWSGGGGGM